LAGAVQRRELLGTSRSVGKKLRICQGYARKLAHATRDIIIALSEPMWADGPENAKRIGGSVRYVEWDD
jgi:hypothetical protein